MNILGTNLSGWFIYQACVGWTVQWKTSLEAFPSNFEIGKQLLFFMFVEDTLFHFMHRLFHSKHAWLPLYKLHKKHHEHLQPLGMSAQYAHPIEHLISNFMPSFAGPCILGAKTHIHVVVLFGILRLYESLDGHSGYDFPWTVFRLIPFGGGPSYHYFHHTHNCGNYSSFTTIWDSILDSNKAYYEDKSKID